MSMSTSSKGRPRKEESRQQILEAAFSLMLESGYPAMSIEAVARTAKVGKTTIYRWWRSRAHLAIDAFFEVTKHSIEFPDTGSAAEDIRVQVHRLADLLRAEEGGVILSLVMGSKFDPDLRKELFESWIKPRKIWGVQKLSQLNPPNVDVALNSLYGPLYAPLLFGLAPLGREEVDLHLDLFFRGLQP